MSTRNHGRGRSGRTEAERPAASRRSCRFAAAAVAAAAVLFLGDPASALDFGGGCGIGGVPLTGWNRNTDTKTHKIKVPCGTEKSFTAQFNAKLTQADKDAGGAIIKIVDGEWDGDHLLLKTTIECAKLAAKPVDTEIMGEIKFTLKCTDACKIEGVSIDHVLIQARPADTEVFCRVPSPQTETGETRDSSADVGLEDDPVEGDNEYGCNKLVYECNENVTSAVWGSVDHGRPGEIVPVELVVDAAVLTDSTRLFAGVDRGIAVLEQEILDGSRLLATLAIPVDCRPGLVEVLLSNTEAAVAVPPFHLDPLHWADHTLGNCTLTVTDAGTVGHYDFEHTLGSGFSHPRDTGNQLYTGSLWVGSSPEYVANRDYAEEPVPGWTSSEDPTDWLAFAQHGPYEEILRGAYTDAGAESPLGLRVEQSSRAVLGTDFVLVSYRLTNTSPEPRIALFAGLFLDYDLTEDATVNHGSSDPERGLAWLTDGAEQFAGVLILEIPEAPVPVSNLTMIENPIYIWPSAYMTDEDKFGFLGGVAPEYMVPDAVDPNDWSVLAAVGPFDLLPGETREVAFAVIGAESLDGLFAGAQLAQDLYSGGAADVTPVSFPGGDDAALRALPNPFRNDTRVELRLRSRARVELSVFDVHGRRVRDLAGRAFEAGTHSVGWDGVDDAGRSVAGGIYFLRLATGDHTRYERIVRIR